MLLFLLCFCPSLRAEPKLDVVLSNQKISLEETTSLSIQVEWPRKEAQYTFAFPKLRFNFLTLEQQGESQETFIQSGEEWLRKTFLITLKPQGIGQGKIDSFVIHYLDPSNQKGGSFTVDEQFITVTRPPFKLSSLHLLLLTAGGGGAVILAVFFLLWRGRAKKAVKSSDASSEQHQAVNAAKAIAEAYSKKSQKDLLHELSTLLRHFIHEQYKSKAAQMTDQELLDYLKTQSQIPRYECDSIQKMFNQLHEAKFAGTQLNEREFNHLTKEVIHYIEGKQVVGNP